MQAYEETKFILKKYNISANKKLGQNFLIDDEVINKTIEAAEISKQDVVIEIGPGLGTLTARLLENAKKVIAIELDRKMISILQERFKLYNNFELINQDILKINLQELIKKEKEDKQIKNVKIVANLPYYITTPIIMKLLEEKLDITSITVMVQKEVAERLTAKPGENKAGAITYTVSYYAVAENIINVSRESFVPAPEVDSAVIKLSIRKCSPVIVNDENKFFKLIKFSFLQRRKTFLNSIANSGFVEKEKLRQILQEFGIDENIRGENLSLEQYAQITNKILQK